MIRYDIYYNDGVFYGTMEFFYNDKNVIEKAIEEEIKDNNKNINPMYHISRDNFKEVLR